MKPSGLIAGIIDTATRLQPATFEAKVKEYRRGGLPSQSMGEGVSGTSETVLPAFDKADRFVIRSQKDYTKQAEIALRAVLQMQRIELAITRPADPLPASVQCSEFFGEGAGLVQCANMVVPPRTGKCEACRSRAWREARAAASEA